MAVLFAPASTRAVAFGLASTRAVAFGLVSALCSTSLSGGNQVDGLPPASTLHNSHYKMKKKQFSKRFNNQEAIFFEHVGFL